MKSTGEKLCAEDAPGEAGAGGRSQHPRSPDPQWALRIEDKVTNPLSRR